MEVSMTNHVKWSARILCSLLFLASATSAQGQEIATSFDELSRLVKPGDTVTVTGATGQETHGKILAAGAKWGFLVGFGLGAAIALAPCAGCDYGSYGGQAGLLLLDGAVFGLLGSGAGVLVGALMERSHLVYDSRPRSPAAVSLSPLLTPGRKGLLLSVGF
jgi:hypothetical protein